MEDKYKDLLRHIQANGVDRADRTGVGSRSAFGLTLDFNVSETLPILTGRKISLDVANTELMWFLNGETNIKRFQEKNIKIWDAWADENGELGPVYGHQLRNFNSQDIDQLTEVVDSIKTNPDSRRHIISLWNPVQLSEMRLPPCYLYFQFFVENDKLNMFVVQRSADMFLGVPYDLLLFTGLLNKVAHLVDLIPNEIKVSFVDAHIYSNQEEAVNQYLNTKTYWQPKYFWNSSVMGLSEIYIFDKIITAPVAI